MNDRVSLVVANLGPVVVVEPVQTPCRELLRTRLRARTIVVTGCIGDSTDLLDLVQTAQTRFDSGEPYLPRKYVAAVLIVRKLESGHYWGGKNKGYMYASDLPKGRGVPDEFASISAEVANDLLLKDILIKKPSGGKSKYALNPDRKSEVYAICENAEFLDVSLRDALCRDTDEVSARLLDRREQ